MKPRILLISIVALGIASGIWLAIAHWSGGKDKKADHHLLVVEPENIGNEYSFKANLEPYISVTVASENDGSITQVRNYYGDRVQQGDLLLELRDKSLNSKYRDAVVAYLLARDELKRSQIKLNGTEKIYQRGIVARSELESDQRSLVESQIKFVKNKSVLLEIIKIVGEDIAHIDALDLKNIDEVSTLFARDESVKIYAPASGILLKSQTKTQTSQSGGNNLQLGAIVKDGSALYDIVNDQKYRLELKVSELDIGNLAVGTKAIIIPSSAPQLKLTGKITKVGIFQGEKSTGGGTKFPIEIVSDPISEQQKEKLYLGMSTMIKITGPRQSRLLVPLSAITVVDHNTVVKVIEDKSGKGKYVKVKPGKVYGDRVVIKSGITAGDIVVVPD